MEDETDDRERDRAPHHLARRGVAREIGDGDFGRERSVAAERADVLRRLIRGASASLAQALDERVEQRGGHLVADLDLQLAEARGRPPVVEHRDGVVDHAADEPPAGVVQLRPAADRRHAHTNVKSLAPDESTHQLDRCAGGQVAVPGEHDLRANEERRVALRGQLHRPALTRAVAQARAPAGETQIVRVVVRRVVPLGRSAAHRRTGESVDARHPEIAGGGQLQLAFWAVLHGRLRVASSPMALDAEKRLAAETAAALVEDGMVVGLGTGSTVAYLLPALAARALDLRCVATSPATESAARELGLRVEAFAGTGAPARLDIAIDGADQVDPAGWLVKGGGAAHTREKAVAAAADRFVVIVGSDKLVERLAPPIPLELLDFGIAATLRRLGTVTLRDVPRSPDGGIIADYTGSFDDPRELAGRLSAEAGLIDHGIFPPELVSDVVVASGDDIEIRTVG